MQKVYPKKHLGQHFLKDDNIAWKIVSALTPSDDRLIIEVGPGTGVLTKFLIEKEQFIAFDIDKESIAYLKENYPDHEDSFIYGDFLKEDLLRFQKKLSIIGNFPYNISSQLFFQIYEHRSAVDQVICMIQKEVADRIVAPSGNKTYGILSVLLQAFYDIEYLFTVKPGAFNPPPKVNSGVIRLNRNKVSQLQCDEVLFKKVVKSGFGKRRKTLRNALKELNLAAYDSLPFMDKRAEQLTVEDFEHLTKRIQDGSNAI